MEYILHPKIKKIANEELIKAFKTSTGNNDFEAISDIFLKYWFSSEVWVAYDEELLKMEIENGQSENVIPESKFRLFQKEPETNTWKSLITGVGGYEIDETKHLLKSFSFKDFQIF